MIRKLLIANRGEIACRIIRTAGRMGIATVAVYSHADRNAPHVKLADEAVQLDGPGRAPDPGCYLDMEAVIAAAGRTDATAIHPGYGFLSENADFAEACAVAGLVFVGPPPAAIRAMGDKARAKALMEQAGVPVVPGYRGEDQSPERLSEEADRIGYPMLIKAVASGGGRGMRRVDRIENFGAAFESARREAESAFGDGRVLLEKLVEDARHIEIQIFGDHHGNVVHLGERDCSTQRRHQKVIEEAPAPGLDPGLREAMGAAALKAAKAVDYAGAGTVEFILATDGRFCFLEMNTRLQVEHPVTEMVTGLDLVEWQLRVAMGEPLPLGQNQVVTAGHAIEARLYAEDPYSGFRPQTGKVLYWRPEEAVGEGVRIDHGIAEGDEMTPFYDPLLAKIVAHGATRDEAQARLDAAIRRTPIFGLKTNRSFLLDLLSNEEFCEGRMTTGLIDRWAEQGALILKPPLPRNSSYTDRDRDRSAGTGAAELAAAILMRNAGGWFRSAGAASFPLALSCDGDMHQLTVSASHRSTLGVQGPVGWLDFSHFEVDLPHIRYRGVKATALIDGRNLWLDIDGWTGCFCEPDPLARLARAADPSRILSPVAGLVRTLLVAAGHRVEAGQAVAVGEAMKMETTLTARAAGTVLAVHSSAGEQVRTGDLVVEIVLDEADAVAVR